MTATEFAARSDIVELQAAYAAAQERRAQHTQSGNERGERACLNLEAKLRTIYENRWIEAGCPVEG